MRSFELGRAHFLRPPTFRNKEVKNLPSEKVLKKKQEIVSELVEKLKNAPSGVLVDYKGINVADDTALRKELRESGVEYFVVKNSLLRLAAKEAGLEGLDEVLSGTTAIALGSDDMIAPAKILGKFAEAHKEFFDLKIGFIEGQVISKEEVVALSKLPSKEVLIAQVLGGLNAPISGLVGVLSGLQRGLVVALNAIAEQKSA